MNNISSITNEINSKISILKIVSSRVSGGAFNLLNKTNREIESLMSSIMNIFSQLGGYKDMLTALEGVLSRKLEDIEEIVKSAIKIALKKIISCGIEPTIGDDLIYTGVTFNIKQIDPLAMFGIDPTSEDGSYAYFDNNSGVDSLDFNVFLYSVIKQSIDNSNYNGANWCRIDNGVKTPLFKASFKEYDISTKESNALTIKISESFKGEKLSYFISEYLDSIKLFDNVQIVSSIFDDILGANIISKNKTSDQIAAEKLISKLVDKIIDNVDDESDVLDDSFYTFSNDAYNQMLEDSEKKKDGVFTYNSDPNLTIDREVLLGSLNDLKVDGILISDQTKVLSNTINAIEKDLTAKGKLNKKNGFSFQLDMIRKIISKLATALSLSIFSPRLIYLFHMTTKLYGLDTPENILDFIKKNVNVIKIIVLKIRGIIVQYLISEIKRIAFPLIKKLILALATEKFKIYKKQIDDIKNLADIALDFATTTISTGKELMDQAENSFDNAQSKI